MIRSVDDVMEETKERPRDYTSSSQSDAVKPERHFYPRSESRRQRRDGLDDSASLFFSTQKIQQK